MDETPGDVERELRAGMAVEGPEAEPLHPSPPGPSRLRRRVTGRWLAGVCGGLADHRGIPALVVRIPFGGALVVSALLVNNFLFGYGGTFDTSDGIMGIVILASFAAVIAYAVLWVVLPSEDVPRAPARQPVERGRRRMSSTLRRHPGLRNFPAFILLAIGGAILAERLGIWEPDVVAAIALIAFGFWLFRRDALEAERWPSDVRGGPAEPRELAPPPASLPPRPPRERSPLGWITFGVALLIVCVAAIWTSLAPDTLSTAHRAVGLRRIATIPALGLLVLSIGLIVGSVYGRARWLILPAVLAVPVVLMTSVIRLPLDGEFGGEYVSAHDLDARETATYRNAVGSIYLDLGRFQGETGVARELTLSTVAGTITVVVPFDAHVEVDAFTGLGTLGLGPDSEQGIEVSDSATLEPRHGDGPTFIVHAEVGLGDVHVLRYAATRQQLRELRQQARQERLAERQAERLTGEDD